MLKSLVHELKQLRKEGRVRDFDEVGPRAGSGLSFRGRKVLDFTSWDCLGLNDDPTVRRAAITSIETLGISAGSCRAGTGTFPIHNQAERRLGNFLGMEGSLLFSSRNQAALSLVTALAQEGDLVFVDEASQTPVSDAAYLVNATVITFDGKHPESIEAECEKHRFAKRRFIFVEAVSPSDGAEADILRIIKIANKTESQILVDETHALGVYGVRGAGLCEQLGPAKPVLCQFGSLAFVLSSYLAFVSGSSTLIEYLKSRSRTFISEMSPPPFLGAILERSLDVVELGTAARDKVRDLGNRFTTGLLEIGVRVPVGDSSYIVSVPCQGTQNATALCATLFSRGILADAVSSPGMFAPAGFARFIVTRYHSELDIDNALSALADILPRLSAARA